MLQNLHTFNGQLGDKLLVSGYRTLATFPLHVTKVVRLHSRLLIGSKTNIHTSFICRTVHFGITKSLKGH